MHKATDEVAFQANSLLKARRSVLRETGIILTLAWPIMITQLAQEAMGFVDTLMTAQAGTDELAAIALGTSLWLPLMLTMIGTLMATTPLVAQQVGADREAAAGQHLAQALCIAAVLALIAVFLLNNTTPLLQLFNLPEHLAQKTAGYLEAISWGFPALMFFQALRSFMEGFGSTRPIMLIACAGVVLNIPLNYLFIFGGFGVPALGGIGCGYATAIVLWSSLILASIQLLRSPRFHLVRHSWRWSFPAAGALIHFLRLGVPIGFALLIEASMFSVIALLIANDGAEVIGAHQITFSLTGVIFMIPLSLALALTIRLGQLVGAGNHSGARFATRVGLLLTLLIAIANSALLVLAGPRLARIYTESGVMLELTVTLLGIAALFQLADAIQVCAGGMLRGFKDTAVTLAVVFIAYWIIGLPTGHFLARSWDLGVAGYWWGLLTGLTCGAVLLASRLYRISHAPNLCHTSAARPGPQRMQ
ncbi:MATE family efflux transporter [Marinobacterium lutimaris]|uniref:Multidrug-efflux transporter n=1 Tax=Marinobacterium lutimaris TaxID=568106 RepID=A0A1H5ULI0_9GAMM|nr:MATE family efflux transporter [Marinobacterium lutimaris]SEF75912.1 multidrug resistance protein, MATE family [Marinobacterium lutimaris]